MAELIHMPDQMTKEQMVGLFQELLIRIEVGDSWEGWIEWLLPDASAPADIVAEVRARYRIGNTEGQGGMRFVGELVEQPSE